jgi:hypothetical protein
MFCAARGRGGVLISADGHMALGFTAPIPKRVAQMSMGRTGQGRAGSVPKALLILGEGNDGVLMSWAVSWLRIKPGCSGGGSLAAA